MSLIDVIGYGEGKTIEFYGFIPSELQIAEVAVAFSNRAGGLIVIGVSDDGEVVGLDKDSVDSTLDSISGIIHDMVTPMILPEIYSNRVKDKTVVVIRIFPGATTPYYIKSYGKIKGTFIRVGKTNVQADEERINELERQRFNISFDEDTSCEASESDIEELCRLLSFHMNKEIGKEQLYNFKLIKIYGEIEYFTNAALIILGKLPNSGIRCAKFQDDSDNVFLYKREFNGNIFEQIQGAVSIIGDVEIPIIAVREAVVNAVIHRDYAIIGSDIKIAVYKSRIEIISPGDLPKSITIEDILSGSGRSESRNKVAARIIKECGLMDQWGSGISRILSLCNQEGLKEPTIKEDGIFVRVTFFRHASDEPKQVDVGKSGGAAQTVTDTRSTTVNELIIDSKKATVDELSTANKSSIELKSITDTGPGTAHISIADASSITVIESNTANKSVIKLKKKDLTKSEKELIFNILMNNPIATVKDISEELDISIASVKRRINKLQKEKIIERIGPNKGGHWEVLNNT